MTRPKFRCKSLRTIQQTHLRQVKDTSQGQPSSTKKPGTVVPPPQSARMMQRYISGASIRQIAREEQRDRATVSKIVRSEEMHAFVQNMRERFYALGNDAMAAVEYALRKRKDAALGYRLLSDIGIVPSSDDRQIVATQGTSLDRSTLTPLEIAIAESPDGQINRVGYGMACVIEESARIFGTPLPTAEEYRHGRRVAEVADEIADGNFHQICLTNGSEAKRIRELAEERVRREEGFRSLGPYRVQRSLSRKRRTALSSHLSDSK